MCFHAKLWCVLATVLCTHGHLVETSINLNILMLFQNIRIYESFPKYFWIPPIELNYTKIDRFRKLMLSSITYGKVKIKILENQGFLCSVNVSSMEIVKWSLVGDLDKGWMNSTKVTRGPYSQDHQCKVLCSVSWDREVIGLVALRRGSE